MAETARLQEMLHPNGQRAVLDYFPASGDHRLKTIHHKADATETLSRFDYTYTPDGSIATWQRQFGSAPATRLTLGYDAADQLVSASLAEVADPQNIVERHSYQYDPAGNRVSKQLGTTLTAASFNSANQLTATTGGGKLLVAGHTDEPAKVTVNGQAARTDAQNNYQAWIDVAPGNNTITVEAEDWSPNANTATRSWSVNVTGGAARTFTYDANGNTLADGQRTYQWDAENRLVKIAQGTQEYEFLYDGLGRRVAEKVNGILSRRWIWDGTAIAEQRAADGTTVQRRFFAEGEQRLGGADAGTYFYTRDHLGSIRELTDATAAVRARYDYDPYGTRTKLGGDLDCDFGFTGHFTHDVSGLVLTLYRAYDPETGRWLSPDPIAEAGGLNLYMYAYGDPLNLFDPDGRSPEYWKGFFGHIFSSEGANDLALGAMATADGIVPFSDPFKDFGAYDDCEIGAADARRIGKLAQDIGTLALGGAAIRSAGAAFAPRGAGAFQRWATGRYVYSKFASPYAWTTEALGSNAVGRTVGVAMEVGFHSQITIPNMQGSIDNVLSIGSGCQ